MEIAITIDNGGGGVGLMRFWIQISDGSEILVSEKIHKKS